jgi:antitoxin VapB
MMEIDQVAALRTTLDFHLLLTQSNPPARKSLPPLWIAPITLLRDPIYIYTMGTYPQEVKMLATAKLFTTGRSQAVRLPREFCFQGAEVFIRRGEVVLSAKPASWQGVFRICRPNGNSAGLPGRPRRPAGGRENTALNHFTHNQIFHLVPGSLLAVEDGLAAL